MSLPTLRLTLRLPDPNYKPIFADHSPRAINMDEYEKDYEVEVEVVQLNLNTGGMRVRFPWPSKRMKKGYEIRSQDVSIEHFYKQFEIKEKETEQVRWSGARDRNGGI